jgi:predicted nuclease with TOPRIM domain
MKDEIKEILWIIKSCKQDYDKQKDGMHTFDYGELYLLYNYITNLQTKNEYLETWNSEIKLQLDNLQQRNNNLKEDFKRHIDRINELTERNDNLQQENYELNRMCELYGKSLYYAELKDYKSRCEKAIEYNNQIIKDTKDFYRPTTDIIYSGDCLIDIAKNNINILQNGSDDNE